MELNRSLSPNSDRLVVGGTLAFGGVLQVVLGAGAPAPQAGDVYQLFNKGSSSAFSTINLPDLSGLPGDLAWDTTKLAVNGRHHRDWHRAAADHRDGFSERRQLRVQRHRRHCRNILLCGDFDQRRRPPGELGVGRQQCLRSRRFVQLHHQHCWRRTEGLLQGAGSVTASPRGRRRFRRPLASLAP